MRGPSITLTVAAVLISAGTPAEAQSFEDRWSAQAAGPYLPPGAHVPTATAPTPETTGHAPTASKKMGAEMDSADDLRPAPDPE